MPSKFQGSSFYQACNRCGFSLIELLICLALLAILSFIVGPSFSQLYQHSQSDEELKTLTQILRFARNQALSQQSRVSVCPSRDGKSCFEQWQNGIMVYVDHNQNNQRDNLEPLLKLTSPLSERSRIVFTGTRQQLRFSNSVPAEGNAGSFIFCPLEPSPHLARSLIINFQGRARKGVDNNADGIYEFANGKNIDCSRV